MRPRGGALTTAPASTYSSSGTTAMTAFSQSSLHGDGNRALKAFGPPPAYPAARPDRSHPPVGERPRLGDIGWRRALRLRLVLADADEPWCWSD